MMFPFQNNRFIFLLKVFPEQFVPTTMGGLNLPYADKSLRINENTYAEMFKKRHCQSSLYNCIVEESNLT